MKSVDEAKLGMFSSIKQYCQDNDSTVQANKAFSDAFANFLTVFDDIQKTVTAHAKRTTGLAQVKNEAKVALCTAATDVASIIVGFANKTHDLNLVAQADYSLSDFMHIKDDELGSFVRNIYELALEKKSDLVNCGLTDAKLAALGTYIEDFQKMVPQPKTAIGVKKTINKNLKDLFKKADTILKKEMDKFSVSYKNDYPDFYSSYKNIRHINSSHGPSHAKNKGNDNPPPPPVEE